MSITDLAGFIKSASPALKRDILVICIIILGVLGGFALGRLSAISSLPISIEQRAAVAESLSVTQGASSAVFEAPEGAGSVVASRNGSKYFFPWCGGARTIKEENKVWFDSVKSARSAGYLPAGNCKGLQ